MWQPIETAPKVETEFENEATELLLYDENDGRYIGWWRKGQWRDSEYIFYPTHWMPLPEPPK